MRTKKEKVEKKAAPKTEQKVTPSIYIPTVDVVTGKLLSMELKPGHDWYENVVRSGRYFTTKQMCDVYLQASDEMFDEMKQVEKITRALQGLGELIGIGRVGGIGIQCIHGHDVRHECASHAEGRRKVVVKKAEPKSKPAVKTVGPLGYGKNTVKKVTLKGIIKRDSKKVSASGKNVTKK